MSTIGDGKFDPMANAQHWALNQAMLNAGGHPQSDFDDSWEDLGGLAAGLSAFQELVIKSLERIGVQLKVMEGWRQNSAPASTSRSRMMLIAGAVVAGLAVAAGTIYTVAQYVIDEVVKRVSLAYDNSLQNRLGNQTITYQLEGPSHIYTRSNLVAYDKFQSSHEQRVFERKEKEEKYQLSRLP